MFRFKFKIYAMMVSIMVFGILLYIMSTYINIKRYVVRSVRSSECTGHLSQIGLALRNYHSAYGCFPPAYIADAQGKPMHSWRVLILPFLEQQHLYNLYNFNEPWDGPSNSKLFVKMPHVYACPNHRGDFKDPSYTGTIWTSYLAITGEGTAFPGSLSTSIDNISDNKASTIIIAENKDMNVVWTQPKDFNIRNMSFVINNKDGKSISSYDPQGPHVLSANGARLQLRKNINKFTVKYLITINGHEKFANDWFVK